MIMENKNLTEEGKSYIKSTRLWLKHQDLLVNSLESDLKYLEQKCDIVREQITVEGEFKRKTENTFHHWCKDNDIDPNVDIDDDKERHTVIGNVSGDDLKLIIDRSSYNDKA